MGVNVGSQTVFLDYYAPANSDNINKRFLDIRKTGIYSGGYLTVVNGTTCQVSTFLCEISDGTRQIRVATGSTVNVTVSSATPYVVVRWAYNAVKSENYAQITAVATPTTYDLVIGKCVFVGGSLTGFNYGDSTYPRTNPKTSDLWLAVQETQDTELRVRIRGGYVQDQDGAYYVADQKSDLLSAPTSNSKIYLIYVDTSDGSIGVDSSGTAAATPSAPDYDGRLILAEVTVSSTSTNITQSMIKDVRPFLTTEPPTIVVTPDEDTIVYDDPDLKIIKVRDPIYHSARYIGNQTATTSYAKVRFDDTIKQSGISQTSSVFTLTANRLYAITYRLQFGQVSSDVTVNSRLRVLTGDTGWGLDNTTSNITLQTSRDSDSNWYGYHAMTVYILPSSTTTFQIEFSSSSSYTIAYSSISICSIN